MTLLETVGIGQVLVFLLFLVALAALVAEFVLVPLGAYRAAYYVGYVAWPRFVLPPAQVARVLCAWALCRRRGDVVEGAEWLERRLATAESLRASDVVAHGMLLGRRGRIADARQVLGSAALLTHRDIEHFGARLAEEWLVLDALGRGDWAQIEKSRRTSRQRPTATTRLLYRLAERLRAPIDGPPLAIWWAWIWSRCRGHTRPLVERVLRIAPGAAAIPTPGEIVTPVVEDEIDAALRFHGALLSRPRASLLVSDLEAIIDRWNAAAAALRVSFSRRALRLGAGSVVDKAIDGVLRDAAQDLLSVYESAGLPLGNGRRPQWFDAVVKRAAKQALSDIELASEALAKRIETKTKPGALALWGEAMGLTTLVRNHVRVHGLQFRRLAFAATQSGFEGLGLYFTNVSSERALGNALFRMLAREAQVVGDFEAAEVYRRNVRKTGG